MYGWAYFRCKGNCLMHVKIKDVEFKVFRDSSKAEKETEKSCEISDDKDDLSDQSFSVCVDVFTEKCPKSSGNPLNVMSCEKVPKNSKILKS